MSVRSRWSRSLALAAAGPALAAAIATVPAAAQENGPVDTSRRPEIPKETIEGNAVALSLEQIIEMALRNNLDIAVSRYEAQKSANEVISQKGTFDPVLTASAFDQEATAPTASTLEAETAQSTAQQVWSTDLTQTLGYGAEWSTGAQATRFSTNNPFTFLNPSYRSTLSLSYTQPLLRNAGRDAAQYGLRVARNNRGISNEAFRSEVLDVISSAMEAYWDLVFSIEDLAVRERSLELANDLVRQNKIMVDVGTLAPIEITVARAEVASRQEAIIVARGDLEDAEDNLLQILNVSPSSPMWERPLYPLDMPVFKEVDVNVDDAYAAALRNRPELAQKELEIQNALLGVDYSRDQLRPKLDLQLSLEYQGLSGTVDPSRITPVPEALVRTASAAPDPIAGPTPDDVISEILAQTDGGSTVEASTGSFSDAFDQAAKGNFDTWSVALNFSFPLGNRAAKAQLANARLDYQQTLTELESLKDTIRVEVRQAVRALTTSRERVQAAGVTRELREEQFEAEKKKFAEGLSTNYQVLQFQRDLEAARSSETQAVVDYSKSIVELKKITGDLLDDLNIRLVMPEATVPR